MSKLSRFAQIATILTLFIAVSNAAFAEDFNIDQKDKVFLHKGQKIERLAVKVGDVVHFKNLDPYFHNVFSLSDAKLFDLGSFPQGQEKAVTFNKAGKVEVECAIHPQMHLVIEVK